jgi:hypothetical protein
MTSSQRASGQHRVARAGRLRRALLPLLPALALASGCHPLNLLSRDRPGEKPDEPAVPVPGAPGKYSFRLAPYVFFADFEVQRNAPLFQELARLPEQVFKELLLPPGTGVIQVYLFETKERYEQFMQSTYPGLPSRRAFFVAQPRTIGGAEDLRVYTYWGERIRQDLRHELTHALLHSVIKDVPLWLDEGLAEFFELPPENDGVNTGHVAHLRRAGGGRHQPDLARLEGLKEVEQMTPAEYREAWAWAHLLLRSHPEAKTALLSYLQQLRGLRHPGALRPQLAKVFPDPEATLEAHLARLESAPARDERALAPARRRARR